MLLRRWKGKLIAEAFELPELELEVPRAVDQVESMITGTEAKAEKHVTEEIKVTAATALSSPAGKQ